MSEKKLSCDAKSLKEIVEKIDGRLYGMLLELSKTADEARYFPFPIYFRKTEGKQIIPGIESYSPDDYDAVVEAQQKVPATKEAAIELLNGEVDIATIQIMLYIFNVKFAMSYYGSTYSDAIEEYEYRYDAITELYRNKKYRERWYLFHGSHPSNWHSILRNGIKNMSHSSLMTTGAVYGPGIYSSDMLSVAYTYGANHECRGSYIAVIELREPYDGYKKAKGIYVLPDSVAFVPRYLLKLSSLGVDIGAKILQFYSELRKKSLATPTSRRRFERDFNELYLQYQAFDYSIYEVKQDEVLCATIHNVNLRIYYASYPAEAPIVTIETKTLDEKVAAALHLTPVEDEFVLVLPCTQTWSPLDTLKKVIDECVEAIVTAIAI